MRRRWLLGLIPLVGVAAAVCIPGLYSVAWVGRKTLQVNVLVVDTDELTSISDAEVTVFQAPTLWEGTIQSRKHADFVPDESSPATKSFRTDARGQV